MSHFSGRTWCIVSDIMRYMDCLTSSRGLTSILTSISKSRLNHFSKQKPDNRATMSATGELFTAGEATDSYTTAIDELRAKTEE